MTPQSPSSPPLDVTGRPTALRDLDLDAFFHPKTVAVIGASATSKKPNTAMWRKISAWGRRAGADVIPVHPKYDEIDGVRCYDTIAEVPGEVIRIEGPKEYAMGILVSQLKDVVKRLQLVVSNIRAQGGCESRNVRPGVAERVEEGPHGPSPLWVLVYLYRVRNGPDPVRTEVAVECRE